MTYISAAITAENQASMVRHLRSLADMIEEFPAGNGWTISDTEGSSLADWKISKNEDNEE